MKEWQIRFRRWLEMEHPWLADCGLEVLIPSGVVLLVCVFMARWFPFAVNLFGLPWCLLVLVSLIVARRPAHTDSHATRRAMYLWLVAFAPLAPALIPLNADEMLLEIEFGLMEDATSLVAVLALAWPWAYAAVQFLNRPIGRTGEMTVLSILVAGSVAYVAVEQLYDTWFRLYLVVFPLITIWLVAVRLPFTRRFAAVAPGAPVFVGMVILCLASLADVLLYFSDGGPVHCYTRLWDPDDAWLYVSRYAFAMGVPLLGFGCVGVAEGVAGK